MGKEQYETVFVVDPTPASGTVEDCVREVRQFLTKKGAKVVYEEDWGLRKLAYLIAGKGSGRYHLLEFQSLPTLIAELEVLYRRDDRIIRHLVVHLDKHAIAFNRKEQERKAQSKKRAEEEVEEKA